MAGPEDKQLATNSFGSHLCVTLVPFVDLGPKTMGGNHAQRMLNGKKVLRREREFFAGDLKVCFDGKNTV